MPVMETVLGRLGTWLANGLAELDPAHRARCRSLAGRTIAGVLGETAPLTFLILPDGAWRSVAPGTPPDLTIRIPAAAIPGLILGGSREPGLAQLRALGVEFEGDMELARSLQAILRSFHVDWEEHLSRMVGDVPAYYASQTAQQAGRAATQSRAALLQNVADWLLFDAQLLPHAGEVGCFLRDTDTLRDDVARLAARIALLKTRTHAVF